MKNSFIQSTFILKKLDSWAWPIAAAFGWILGWLFSWIHGQKAQEVLILRPGGMGDLVLLTLAWEKLPHNRSAIWLIEKRSEPWAKHLGLRYECYDRRTVFVLLRLAGRFSWVINTEQRYGLSQAFALAAKHRRGSLTCFSTNLAADLADHQVAYDPNHTHEFLSFSRILKNELPDTARGEIGRRFPAGGKPVVAISGLQFESRRLRLDQWEKLIHTSCGERPFYLVAAPMDREFQQELARRFEPRCEIVNGDFNAICALISRAEKVITVDGGMVHVASYYGVPTTVVFTSGQLKKWAPLGSENQVIVRNDLPCQPCTLFGQVPPCSHGFACREISVLS